MFHQIVTKDFDVLITDLHRRRTQDDLRLVTAKRHFQPEALLVAVSDSLDLQQAMNAIRLGIDVIVKLLHFQEVAELINARTKSSNPLQSQARVPVSPKTEEEVQHEDRDNSRIVTRR